MTVAEDGDVGNREFAGEEGATGGAVARVCLTHIRIEPRG